MQDHQVYQRLAQEETWYLFITDLARFVKMLHIEERKTIEAMMFNLLDKGFLHNIFVFGAMNHDDRRDIMDIETYRAFTAMKAGIHLGGKVQDQRTFDFSSMPFAMQSAAMKPPRGVTAPTDTEEWHILVLPQL